ncbi:MAG: threonine synthase [Chitinophagaceae bacterium]|nr:MAG: threonine synthase [Chitinophagaceae bacterium]
MKYYSLNNHNEIVDFRLATIQGQASDKGLFFPECIPQLSASFINDLKSLNVVDMGVSVMKPYVGTAMPDHVLQNIIEETLSFPIPLKGIHKDIFSLELFHGPTLAFKDVGARFMSRCLGYFLQNETKKVTVLVATSGDTGGAVANGFYDVDGIDVVILYPKGRVSPVQEKQLTTLGKNITALEVEGSFDDCQQMVKQAFLDTDIKKKRMLSSANSINVARWLPQQLYYFMAYQQWQENVPPTVCVPSGNFGNICAGLLAKVSGLPLGHFIAACNINDIVSEYLSSGNIKAKNTSATLSNAMDVGNPSNLVRVLQLFQNKFDTIKSNISSDTITDEVTLDTIQKVYKTYHYLLDPHGAVAYKALETYLSRNKNQKGFIVETAHPIKFPDAVKAAIGLDLEVPESLKELMQQEKKSIEIKNTFSDLKDFLML